MRDSSVALMYHDRESVHLMVCETVAAEGEMKEAYKSVIIVDILRHHFVDAVFDVAKAIDNAMRLEYILNVDIATSPGAKTMHLESFFAFCCCGDRPLLEQADRRTGGEI